MTRAAWRLLTDVAGAGVTGGLSAAYGRTYDHAVRPMTTQAAPPGGEMAAAPGDPWPARPEIERRFAAAVTALASAPSAPADPATRPGAPLTIVGAQPEPPRPA